ncbi:MAG: class I SAM-dependent methyltransferase [Candidatus Promineifilaceae bacterium]
MRAEIVQRLIEINHIFYRDFATEFSGSRYAAWDGFAPLAAHLPDPCSRFLDVGCGEGRLGRYLLEADRVQEYIGVDFSEGLIAEARARAAKDTFFVRNLVAPDALAGFGRFQGIASIAVLHHIPGYENRLRLVREMAAHLEPDGRLIVSGFQFLNSERLRRKLLDWSVEGVDSAELEPKDYLMDWKRGGNGTRYLALIDHAEKEKLAHDAGLTIVDQYSMDGKEGNLNLYTVLAASPTNA